MHILLNLITNDDGVTAIEYALIAAFIALAIFSGATAVGESLKSIFVDLAPSLGSGS